MRLSSIMIQGLFPQVFNNEFNTRKILHSFVDETWGSYIAVGYATNTFDFQMYGRDYYNAKCNAYSKLKRTLVLTQDMNGNIELFGFWVDHKGNCCYSQIENNTKLPSDFTDSRNALRKYFV